MTRRLLRSLSNISSPSLYLSRTYTSYISQTQDVEARRTSYRDLAPISLLRNPTFDPPTDLPATCFGIHCLSTFHPSSGLPRTKSRQVPPSSSCIHTNDLSRWSSRSSSRFPSAPSSSDYLMTSPTSLTPSPLPCRRSSSGRSSAWAGVCCTSSSHVGSHTSS